MLRQSGCPRRSLAAAGNHCHFRPVDASMSRDQRSVSPERRARCEGRSAAEAGSGAAPEEIAGTRDCARASPLEDNLPLRRIPGNGAIARNRGAGGRGGPPHKRLLKELMSLPLPFGFRQTLGDFRPLAEGLRQSLRRYNRRADFPDHILGLTPLAPADSPFRSPRGKSFSRRRSDARPEDWSTVSHVTKHDNWADLSWASVPAP